jgi:hypothetical protein
MWLTDRAKVNHDARSRIAAFIASEMAQADSQVQLASDFLGEAIAIPGPMLKKSSKRASMSADFHKVNPVTKSKKTKSKS